MSKIKSLFIYPVTAESLKPGTNPYISDLIKKLSLEYSIINKKTSIGLIDLLIKLKRTDIIYFNWIEDLPEKKFGRFQMVLLKIILKSSKIWKKKIIWFIHNNVSHDKSNLPKKYEIIRLMTEHSDLIFSHSNEIQLNIPRQKLYVFPHPIKHYQPLEIAEPIVYDLLIWGSVSPYKGVAEFVQFVKSNNYLQEKKILIAGKFVSDEYYQKIIVNKLPNITVINKSLPNEELENFMAISKYVLFTYNSNSVLSSAALCHSLSYGKEIIAPEIGSFRELGDQGLLYTYQTFEDIEVLLENLKSGKLEEVDSYKIQQYAEKTNWSSFSFFLHDKMNALFDKKTY